MRRIIPYALLGALTALVIAAALLGANASPTRATLTAPVVGSPSATTHLRQAVPASCTAPQLSASVGTVMGAGEHWMIPLQFQNISSASCSLSGYPEVRSSMPPVSRLARPFTTESGIIRLAP